MVCVHLPVHTHGTGSDQMTPLGSASLVLSSNLAGPLLMTRVESGAMGICGMNISWK